MNSTIPLASRQSLRVRGTSGPSCSRSGRGREVTAKRMLRSGRIDQLNTPLPTGSPAAASIANDEQENRWEVWRSVRRAVSVTESSLALDLHQDEIVVRPIR